MSNYVRFFEDNKYVFLTIVTNKREALLVKNIDLLRAAFENSKQFYKYKIVAIIVLPEHLHMVIQPENIIDYPKIVSRIKHYFSRNIECQNVELSESKISKREKGIWQRRYWEHTIRDEADLNKHIDYIHYNPVKHKLVRNVKDWKYSTFNKFVKKGLYDQGWGSFQEAQDVIELE